MSDLQDLGIRLPRQTERGERRFLQHTALRRLDALGLEVVAVISVTEPAKSGTYARPPRFAAQNGEEYWVKTKAQSGLMADLSGGRLAGMVGTGPPSTVIRAASREAALQMSPSPYDDQAVGSLHIPGCLNRRQLRALVGDGQLPSGLIDIKAWTAASVFQSWIAALDPQVLVRLEDGAVFTIDYGACFDKLLGGPPEIVVAEIPGARMPPRFVWSHVEEALNHIFQLSEDSILSAFARMPEAGPWQGLFQRRLDTADWLIKRRNDLPPILEKRSVRIS